MRAVIGAAGLGNPAYGVEPAEPYGPADPQLAARLRRSVALPDRPIMNKSVVLGARGVGVGEMDMMTTSYRNMINKSSIRSAEKNNEFDAGMMKEMVGGSRLARWSGVFAVPASCAMSARHTVGGCFEEVSNGGR